MVTSKSGFDTVPAAVGTAVARVPGVRQVSAVRHDEAKVFGKTVSVDGDRSRTSPTASSSGYEQGSDAVIPRLGASGAIVTKAFADDHALRVGSAVPHHDVRRPQADGRGSRRSRTRRAT